MSCRSKYPTSWADPGDLCPFEPGRIKITTQTRDGRGFFLRNDPQLVPAVFRLHAQRYQRSGGRGKRRRPVDFVRSSCVFLFADHQLLLVGNFVRGRLQKNPSRTLSFYHQQRICSSLVKVNNFILLHLNSSHASVRPRMYRNTLSDNRSGSMGGSIR